MIIYISIKLNTLIANIKDSAAPGWLTEQTGIARGHKSDSYE